MTNSAIGRTLGVGEASVRRGLDKAAGRMLLTEQHPYELPAPLSLQGDWAITADWHIPITRYEYANEMIREAQERGISNLLIAGDFWNMDALSRFDPKQQAAGLQGEHEAGLATMATLLDWFERIVICWGNHDDRLARALGFKLEFTQAMRLMFGQLGEDLLDRLELTNYDHVWLDDTTLNGHCWYVCHPQAYTRVPLSGGRQLAAKHNANVIVAHSHHAAIGYATDGVKVVAEVGGLFDATKTEYLRRSTTYPVWANGYILFKNGLPLLRSTGFGAGAG